MLPPRIRPDHISIPRISNSALHSLHLHKNSRPRHSTARMQMPSSQAVAAWLVCLSAAPALALNQPALPQGVLEIPLQRIKNQSAYGIEFHIGNPPQKVVTSVDTGSPTYGFESPSM